MSGVPYQEKLTQRDGKMVPGIFQQRGGKYETHSPLTTCGIEDEISHHLEVLLGEVKGLRQDLSQEVRRRERLEIQVQELRTRGDRTLRIQSPTEKTTIEDPEVRITITTSSRHLGQLEVVRW